MAGVTAPFRGCIVCFTGVSRAEQSRLSKLVDDLGGTFGADLTADTTHLVALDVYTKKYLVAHRENICVVTTKWLTDCAAKRALLPPSNYRLPPLSGLVICVTQLGAGTIWLGESGWTLFVRSRWVVLVSKPLFLAFAFVARNEREKNGAIPLREMGALVCCGAIL